MGFPNARAEPVSRPTEFEAAGRNHIPGTRSTAIGVRESPRCPFGARIRDGRDMKVPSKGDGMQSIQDNIIVGQTIECFQKRCWILRPSDRPARVTHGQDDDGPAERTRRRPARQGLARPGRTRPQTPRPSPGRRWSRPTTHSLRWVDHRRRADDLAGTEATRNDTTAIDSNRPALEGSR
jgi:hypothetical protein